MAAEVASPATNALPDDVAESAPAMSSDEQPVKRQRLGSFLLFWKFGIVTFPDPEEGAGS